MVVAGLIHGSIPGWRKIWYRGQIGISQGLARRAARTVWEEGTKPEIRRTAERRRPPNARDGRSAPRALGGAHPGGRLPLAAACLLTVIGVVLVFGQTISFDWVNFDDRIYVYNNPPVRAGLSWTGLRWAFSHFHASNWHPLTWISHMLDCQVYGLWPGGHHLTNVVLHATSACCCCWSCGN